MINLWIRAASLAREIKQVAEISDIRDRQPMAAATVSGDSNQPNSPLTLTSVREDGDWTVGANSMSFGGAPDRVRIHAQTYYQQNQSGAFARINPELELLKNGAVVAKSGTGYQRHGSGHDSSSNDISYVDPNPGTNPVYQLRAQQGSTQNDFLAVDIGSFSCEAVL